MGRPVARVARVSSHTRGSGSVPPLRSSAASRIPLSSARQAAMTTSWRSPGTTMSRPSVSTRRPPGTPCANTATSLMRRDRSPSLSTRGFSSRTRSRTRNHVNSGRCGTAPMERRPRSATASTVPVVGSSSGCAVRSARSSPPPRPATGQLATSRTSASSALASAWLSPLAYSLVGPGLSASTTTTSDRSWTGCQAATIVSSTTSSPPAPSCCSSWPAGIGSGGCSAVVAATSAVERSGPPSARGWATGLTKATFTPRRSRARTRPRQVLARPTPAAVGTTSKVRAMTSAFRAVDRSSIASDDAGGVAGDQELLIRRYDEGQHRAAEADAPPGVPAVLGIGFDVLSQAEEAQPAEHQATDDGAVFPDSASEDQCVEPLKPYHQGGDRLGQPIHENVEGEPGPLVSVSGGLCDGAHIVAHAGQPLKPAVDVQCLGDLVDIHPGPAGQVADKARIDITGAGPHDQPLQWGQPHGRVHRHAVAHCGRAAPIAQVGSYQPELTGQPAEHGCGLLADEAVTGAMESVSSHPVAHIPLLGYCVAKGMGRHRLMERGVEHGDLRQAGQGGTHSLDPGKIRRVVQRRQVVE